MRIFNHLMLGLWALGIFFLIASCWDKELVKWVHMLWAMPAGAYAGVAAARLGW